MKNTEFSFIILTYNEEQHLPRLLDSIKNLNATIIIVDSFSTDRTLEIANSYGVHILTNKFINHPKQWDFALKNCRIETPWTIGLDADQIITPELFNLLNNFKSSQHEDINGIYFNRKNIFRGKWIRYGGMYPKYLLKMFRTNIGISDLNENMDHRFTIQGKSIIWKNGNIIEENLKENFIRFWIEKHNTYSDLVAREEIERQTSERNQTVKPNFFGSPDERIAQLKQIWWKMPLGFRPFIYFIYRSIFRFGILDGSTGMLFHFLQGFWFRLIVDVKIKELKKQSINSK